MVVWLGPIKRKERRHQRRRVHHCRARCNSPDPLRTTGVVLHALTSDKDGRKTTGQSQGKMSYIREF